MCFWTLINLIINLIINNKLILGVNLLFVDLKTIYL